MVATQSWATFQIILNEVKIDGEADLGVERDGKLRSQTIVRFLDT